jgi:type II secretory pathway component HofQ
LRFLLAQINGAYLIRKDYIEITTVDRQVSEAFDPGTLRTMRVGEVPPTVNVVFEGRPLEKALADLASQTGMNIVLDPRVADRDKLSVSGQFLNTPLDSAVRVVADMVDLEPVRSENVYYVTTKENALRLHDQWLNRPAPPAPKSAAPPASPGK